MLSYAVNWQRHGASLLSERCAVSVPAAVMLRHTVQFKPATTYFSGHLITYQYTIITSPPSFSQVLQPALYIGLQSSSIPDALWPLPAYYFIPTIATMTEVFPCFFLGCKANDSV